MKSILECSTEERMKRALLAIESLASCFMDACHNEKTDKYKQFSDLYMIAHAATSKCRHNDWLEKIEECEKHAKEARLYDVEKM